jgi:hypothetical protein
MLVKTLFQFCNGLFKEPEASFSICVDVNSIATVGIVAYLASLWANR